MLTFMPSSFLHFTVFNSGRRVREFVLPRITPRRYGAAGVFVGERAAERIRPAGGRAQVSVSSTLHHIFSRSTAVACVRPRSLRLYPMLTTAVVVLFFVAASLSKNKVAAVFLFL